MHSKAESSGEMAVLMVLAHCAKLHGGNSFPSVDLIAEMSHLSVRQVQRHIRSAEGRGEIIVHARVNGNRSRFCFTIGGLQPWMDCEECEKLKSQPDSAESPVTRATSRAPKGDIQGTPMGDIQGTLGVTSRAHVTHISGVTSRAQRVTSRAPKGDIQGIAYKEDKPISTNINQSLDDSTSPSPSLDSEPAPRVASDPVEGFTLDPGSAKNSFAPRRAVRKGINRDKAAKPTNPLHAPVREMLGDAYRHYNQKREMPWEFGRDDALLARALKACPSWTADDWERAIGNRFESEDVNPSSRPTGWIGKLPDYAAGSLDRFGKLRRGG